MESILAAIIPQILIFIGLVAEHLMTSSKVKVMELRITSLEERVKFIETNFFHDNSKN